MKGSGLVLAVSGMLVLALLASCSSTRYQEGFSYRPAQPGPDMGSGEERLQVAGERRKVEERQQVEGVREKVGDNTLQELVQTGIDVQAAQQEPVQFKTTVRQIARQYGEQHKVSFTEKQLKKLDKISAKLEKKQGPDVSWGPSNNLEWAILGAAAVGLFVGIFGIGFGWFIFAIAALAYLYFKLLHNN